MLQLDPITGYPYWSEDTSIAGDMSQLVAEDPNARQGPFGMYTADPDYQAPIHTLTAPSSAGVDVGFSDLARLLETGATAYINLDRARTALQISRDSNAMARAASRNILADPMFMIAVAGLFVALMKS